MKGNKARIIAFIFLVLILLLLRFTLFGEYFTFEKMKKSSGLLHAEVERHYFISVVVFIALYISTAFFVPGTLVLTIAGGFLFGAVPGTLYANLGAISGASMAFLLARYLAGNWIQDKYRFQLKGFNEAVRRGGYMYLITLRIVPAVPFFLVNFLAGLTKISYRTFLWTTLAGMLPGSVVYSFAGRQLRSIKSPGDIYSREIIAALVVLCLFSIVPAILKYMRTRRPPPIS